jgi:hypothetical protein
MLPFERNFGADHFCVAVVGSKESGAGSIILSELMRLFDEIFSIKQKVKEIYLVEVWM